MKNCTRTDSGHSHQGKQGGWAWGFGQGALLAGWGLLTALPPKAGVGGDWGYPNLWGMTAKGVPMRALVYGDSAMPLGGNLLEVMGDKICRGEFIDVLTLLV